MYLIHAFNFVFMFISVDFTVDPPEKYRVQYYTTKMVPTSKETIKNSDLYLIVEYFIAE